MGRRRGGPWREDPRRVLDEELDFHLSERARALEAEGLTPAEARARAEREFGDVEGTRAYCVRQDRWRDRHHRIRERWSGLRDDTAGVARALLRRPRPVVAPVGVLTVGIALNALAFTVVRSVLLAPLSFTDADRVHVLEEVQDGGGLVRAAYPVLEAWRASATTLEAVGGHLDNAVPVITPSGPLHVKGAAVTRGFFELVDDPVMVGRWFSQDEHLVGAARSVMVSERFWRRVFPGDEPQPGATLRVNGEGHVVVGIVRNDAIVPDGVELWMPVEPTYPGLVDIAGAKIFIALGRVRPGVAPADAARELSALSASVEGGAPGARTTPVAERLLGDVRTPLLLLQASVLLVLLATCANAGGMLLTRSVRRGPEIAVRTSLGAGRARVAGTLMLEGLMIGLVAGVLGVAAAAALLGPTLALVPGELPRATEISLDPQVVLFGLALAGLTGILTALAPALRGASVQPAALLRQSAGSTGTSTGFRRVLDGFVVGQVALAMLLTVGAGLLLRSFVATVSEDPGFDPSEVTVLDVSLPGHRYEDDAARVAFARELLDRAASLPGATAVALGRNLPITGSNMTSPLLVEGREGQTHAAQIAMVSEGYFDVLRIPVAQGTVFRGADRDGAPPVMIVDETLVGPDGAPIELGERVRSYFAPNKLSEVIGIARPVRHQGLRAAPTAIAYRPFFQSGGTSAFSLLVRSDAPTGVVASAAQALVRELDPELPADRVGTMSAHVRRSLAEPRFYTVGLSVFGGLALLLALAGCQAGLAHRVAARRRELGLRMALGASSPSVRALVRRRGVGLTAAGAAVGLAGAWPATRVLESQLYGVGAHDPWTILGATALLLAGGALAADLPARRAATVAPAETLREA